MTPRRPKVFLEELVFDSSPNHDPFMLIWFGFKIRINWWKNNILNQPMKPAFLSRYVNNKVMSHRINIGRAEAVWFTEPQTKLLGFESWLG